MCFFLREHTHRNTPRSDRDAEISNMKNYEDQAVFILFFVLFSKLYSELLRIYNRFAVEMGAGDDLENMMKFTKSFKNALESIIEILKRFVKFTVRH